MTREGFLIFMGLLVAISPFIGVPVAWLEWALPVIGIFIIGTSLLIRHDRHKLEIAE